MAARNRIDWSNVVAGVAIALVPAGLTIIGGTRVLDYAVGKVSSDLENEIATRKAQGIRIEYKMESDRRQTREEMLQLHTQQSREIDDLRARIGNRR